MANSQRKIKSISALSKLLKKRGSRKVVFTNGCFDILHSGHVSYLEKAKSLGDILVVALNTDSSVRRLKGPSRPVNGLQDRLKVIAALESVDYATWYGEEIPLKAILKVHPDCLVKGGDWSVDRIVGGREVVQWGGKVRSLTYVQGKSTTSILKRASRSCA